MAGTTGDLVLLVADKNIDFGVRGVLSRPRAIGIHSIEAQSFVHPKRDPACLHEADDFLRPFVHSYRHALVMFDRHGSGHEDRSGEELAADVRARLAASGWDDRADAVVLDPELEAWVFSPSPNVESCLGWRRSPRIRTWLERQGFWSTDAPKPGDPRAALERVLFEIKRPRSAAIYECLGKRVSLNSCVDAAFVRFRETLVRWFALRS